MIMPTVLQFIQQIFTEHAFGIVLGVGNISSEHI